MSKVEVCSIDDYRLYVKHQLKQIEALKDLSEENINKLVEDFMTVFLDGIKYGRGKLTVELN